MNFNELAILFMLWYITMGAIYYLMAMNNGERKDIDQWYKDYGFDHRMEPEGFRRMIFFLTLVIWPYLLVWFIRVKIVKLILKIKRRFK